MFRRVLEKVEYLIERMSHIFVVISGILTVLMAFTATYGVVRRYLFKSPEPYSYELSMMFLLWTFVLAVAYLEKLDGNLRVDFFLILLPEKIRNLLANIISPILGLLFCVILTWKGWEVAIYSLRISERSMSVWAVPLFPIKIIVPIGFGLLCFVLFVKIIHAIYKMKGSLKKS